MGKVYLVEYRCRVAVCAEDKNEAISRAIGAIELTSDYVRVESVEETDWWNEDHDMEKAHGGY